MEVNYAESKLYTMKPYSTGMNGSDKICPGWLLGWGMSTLSEVIRQTQAKGIQYICMVKSGLLWFFIGQIRVLPYAFFAVCFGSIGSLPRLV